MSFTGVSRTRCYNQAKISSAPVVHSDAGMRSTARPALMYTTLQYLTKQSALLREVNDSRLRVYEQMEVAQCELERVHARLQQEAVIDKTAVRRSL